MSNLKILRLESGLKAIKVAEILGISRVQLNNLERGVNRISSDKVDKLSELYKVEKEKLIELIGGENID